MKAAGWGGEAAGQGGRLLLMAGRGGGIPGTSLPGRCQFAHQGYLLAEQGLQGERCRGVLAAQTGDERPAYGQAVHPLAINPGAVAAPLVNEDPSLRGAHETGMDPADARILDDKVRVLATTDEERAIGDELEAAPIGQQGSSAHLHARSYPRMRVDPRRPQVPMPGTGISLIEGWARWVVTVRGTLPRSRL
ncbi:MAG: hypothetical protein NVSMB32_03970 [Actinomycetota bacterium]